MSFDGRHARPTTLFLKQFGASVYTPIALVDGVSGRGQSRAVVASDGYGSTAMTKVVDPALMLDPFTLTIRYDPAQASHDFTLGLGKWNTVAPPEATTIQILGPDGALPDTDFYRASVDVTKFTFLEPKDDIMRAEVEFTPDGSDLKIDDVQIIGSG